MAKSAWKRWSKKRKIAVSLLLVCAVLASGGIGYYYLKPEPPIEVSNAKTTQDAITETMTVNATVESAKKGNFQILENVKAETINVKIGDRVKKGDVLATFNKASLNSILAEKQAAYDAARTAYNKSVASGEKAAKKETAATTTTTQPATTEAQTRDLVALVNELLKSGEIGFTSAMLILQKIAKGENPLDVLDLSALLGGTDISSALEDVLGNVDISSLVNGTEIGGLMTDTYKAAMDSAKKNLDSTRDIVDSMKNGWVAQNDGVVRNVNIRAGEAFIDESSTGTSLDMNTILAMISGGDTSAITGALSSLAGGSQKTYGMVLEYFPLVASFALNKKDVLKVHVGQQSTIKTQAGNEIISEVSMISPVADNGSGDIDITSLLGGSGSSSGVLARVTIPDPDESVIIGLDIDVTIEVAAKESAVIAPVEVLKFDEKGNFVWVYNEETGEVNRRDIVVGLKSNTKIEIAQGCEAGEILIKTPPQDMAEGQKVSLKTETAK